MSMTGRSTATSSGSAASSAPSTRNSMLSRHFMASDTASEKNEERRPRPDLVRTMDPRLPHPGGERADVVLVVLGDPLPRCYRNRLEKDGLTRSRPKRQWPPPRFDRTRQRPANGLSPISRARTIPASAYTDADGQLMLDSWRTDRPTYRAARSDHPEMDQGRRRARSTEASMRWSARKTADDFIEPAVDHAAAWREVVRCTRGPAMKNTEVRMRPNSRRSFPPRAALPVAQSFW